MFQFWEVPKKKFFSELSFPPGAICGPRGVIKLWHQLHLIECPKSLKTLKLSLDTIYLTTYTLPTELFVMHVCNYKKTENSCSV